LNIASITDNSVAVVSCPVNAVQSLTTIADEITSLPLFTVPAHNGIYSNVDNSSSSATPHIGCTSPPLFEIAQYEPTNA